MKIECEDVTGFEYVTVVGLFDDADQFASSKTSVNFFSCWI